MGGRQPTQRDDEWHRIEEVAESVLQPSPAVVEEGRDQDDKRGPAHALRLPYAPAEAPRFFVPDNLYVIGTLNLAEIRLRSAQLGANEVHIHLLAGSTAQSQLIETDLRGSLALA